MQLAGVALLFVSLTTMAVEKSPEVALPSDHAQRMTRGLELFQKQVRALLIQNCVKCHGGEKTKAEFDLTTREGLLKGGAEGPAVKLYDARASRLYELITHAQDPHMPSKADKLPADAIAQIAAWIDNGAPYDTPLLDGKAAVQRDRSAVSESDRQWWAFQPLKKGSPPEVKATESVKTPIDQFIVAQLAEKKLELNPSADRRTLLRRASFDLLGLPPTPEEVAAFVRDKSPDAWPRLIARLLDSPRYGERWARHWLDVARFAESSGFEHDTDRPNAYHYRDFVIKALNADMPFDQFVRWQIAGDEFDPDNPLALMATGFLGAGVFPTQITANEVERTRYDAMDDMLATTGTAMLGMTVGCARCHDHKFDPIPTRDYYRMLATFTTTVRSDIDLDLQPEANRRAKETFNREHASLVAVLNTYEERELPGKFDAWLNAGTPLPAPPTWELLEAKELKSKAGATFKQLDDGSYLVEGKNGDSDVYTFTAHTQARDLRALRLEALAHPSMNKGGPGRSDNGNIGLSRIRVFASSLSGLPRGAEPLRGGETNEVKLVRARATFEQNTNHLAVASALDENPKTGWAVDPQFGSNNAAIFEFEKPLGFADGTRLEVRLEFELNTRHNIGRPRLGVTTAEQPRLDGEALPPNIAAILENLQRNATARGTRNQRSAELQLRVKEADKRAELELRAPEKSPSGTTSLGDTIIEPTTLTSADRVALLNWWKTSEPGWLSLHSPMEAHARQAPQPKLTKVLVCTEGYPALRMNTQGGDFFTNTYFLQRGSTDLKLEVAPPGFLQVLVPDPELEKRWQWQPPAGAKFSGRRRALANWMTDPDQGAGHLLARVAVNRLWQHHFGQGLVATPNDFGAQGAQPAQPLLLDWLAAELIRCGWRLKPIHQLIMTSGAYQQSSVISKSVFSKPGAEGEDSPSSSRVEPLPRSRGGESALTSSDDEVRRLTSAATSTRGNAGTNSLNTEYFSRKPRRLEAEAIRDSILFVSGVLDTNMFGPGTLDEASRRRSIYFTVKRSRLVPAMQSFDAPEPLVSQGTRPTTTVAPQALMLMNSPHVRAWAAAFVERFAPGPDPSLTAAVARAYFLALNRPPTKRERADAFAFIEGQTKRYPAEQDRSRGRESALTSSGEMRRLTSATTGESEKARELALTDFAQVLLSLNEFIYVE